MNILEALEIISLRYYGLEGDERRQEAVALVAACLEQLKRDVAKPMSGTHYAPNDALDGLAARVEALESKPLNSRQCTTCKRDLGVGAVFCSEECANISFGTVSQAQPGPRAEPADAIVACTGRALAGQYQIADELGFAESAARICESIAVEYFDSLGGENVDTARAAVLRECARVLREQRDPRAEGERCKVCEGRGWSFGDGLHCNACRGTGAAPKPRAEWERCEKCGGRGFICAKDHLIRCDFDEDCPACHGTGAAPQPQGEQMSNREASIARLMYPGAKKQIDLLQQPPPEPAAADGGDSRAHTRHAPQCIRSDGDWICAGGCPVDAWEQAMFGNPVSEYAVSDFIKALFWHIFREAERVHWNINQRQLDAALDNVPTGHAVEVGPVSLRRYQWADQEEHPEIAALPNFVFEDVEMRWYKHPGRGMSTNKNWTYSEWVDWFDRCLKALRDLDRERREQA